MNDDDATSKLRMIHEFNYFNENHTFPQQIIIRRPLKKSSPTSAAYDDHDATSDLRAIHEYDFFDENRTGPRRIHWVPMQGTKDEEHEPPPPPFLRRIVEEIEDPQVAYLFEKNLENSDTRMRLFIGGRGSKRLMESLTEEERMKQERERYVEIRVMDSSGNNYRMRLMHLAAVGMTVIDEEWCKLVLANHLREGVRVRGWGFRKDGEFYLFIN